MVGARVYKVVVEVESPLHVGGGREENLLPAVKIPVVAFYTKGSVGVRVVPIIPRTSLKGILRAYAERIARQMYSGGSSVHAKLALLHHQPTPLELEERGRAGLLKVSPVHTPPGMHPRDAFEYHKGMGYARPRFDDDVREAFEEYLEHAEPEPGRGRITRLHRLGVLEQGRDRLYEEAASLMCPVDRLFGTPLTGGALRFTDLAPEDLDGARTSVRSHVSIERPRRIRAAEKLYRVEYLEPGTKLTGYMTLTPSHTGPDTPKHIAEAWQEALKLLDTLLDYTRKLGYITLGGSKSRGYGLARVEITEAK